MGLAGGFAWMLQIHWVGVMGHLSQVFGTTKVYELQMALCIQQEVLWLEVSVNYLQARVWQAHALTRLQHMFL